MAKKKCKEKRVANTPKDTPSSGNSSNVDKLQKTLCHIFPMKQTLE
jgi:hypothetical protein